MTAVRDVVRGVDRWRPPQPSRALADARGAIHRRRRASTSSTPCSRTCWSSTASPTPTAWPAWRRPSWPVPRSSGGLAVPRVRRLFRRRTDALLLAVGHRCRGAAGDRRGGLVAGRPGHGRLRLAIGLLVGWALVSALQSPIRQAFINGVIPSEQRATVLSFDSLMGSLGGVVTQPVLGRVADVSGYAASYLVAAGINAVALPFVFLARREQAPRTRSTPSRRPRHGRRRPRCRERAERRPPSPRRSPARHPPRLQHGSRPCRRSSCPARSSPSGSVMRSRWRKRRLTALLVTLTPTTQSCQRCPKV